MQSTDGTDGTASEAVRRTLPDRGPKPRVRERQPCTRRLLTARRTPFTVRADSIARCRVVAVATVPLICLLSFVVSTSSFSSVCQERARAIGMPQNSRDLRSKAPCRVSRYLRCLSNLACRLHVTLSRRRHGGIERVHLLTRRVTSGSRPQACGFSADLVTPWSGMEVAPATIRATAQQTRRPRGGACQSGPSSPPKGACISACGRPGSAGSRSRSATSGCRWRRSPAGTTPAGCRRSERARGTRFRLDGGAPYPDPASRFQPEGPHGPSEVIDPSDFAWTDVEWRGVPREGQVIYEMHIGTFTPEGTWARRRRGAAGAGRAGHHRAGGDAGRRLPRRLRLGLRRRQPLRADPALRHAGRLPRASSIARTRSGIGRHPRRRLQPPRPGRQLPRAVLRATTSPTRHTTDWGEAINFDGDGCRGRSASSSSPTPATGSTSSTSTGCASTPRRRSTTTRPSTSWPRSRAARGRAPGAAPIFLVGRERAAGRAARPPGRAAAATAWTRSGTTTSTTAPWWRSPAAHEAYYTDYLGTPQEFDLGRQARLPLSGPALRLAGASAAARRRADSRRRRSSTSSRTTTRSPTPLRGPAAATS